MQRQRWSVRSFCRVLFLATSSSVFACSLAVPALGQSEEPEPAASEVPTMTPIPEVQAELDRITEGSAYESYGELVEAALKLKMDLRQETGDDQEYIRQIVLGLARFMKEPEAFPEMKWTGYVFLMNGGPGLDVSEHDILRALLPHIDASDSSLKSAIGSFIEHVEHRSGLEYYETVLRAERNVQEKSLAELEGIAPAAIRRMLEVDPTGALEWFCRNDELPLAEQQEIVLAAHAVTENEWKQSFGFLERRQVEPAAAEALEQLAKYEQWWVRLYVAEILRVHREYRQPELLDRLQTDEHPLVRRSVEQIRE